MNMIYKKLLIGYLSNLIPLSSEEQTLILSYFKLQDQKQGTYLLHENAFAEELHFIIKGFVGLTAHRDDIPVITDIVSPQHLISDFDSLTKGVRAKSSIVCITDCTFFTINKEDYLKMYEQVPNWSKICQSVYEQRISEQIKRTNELLTLSAKERYLKLFKESPEIVQNIPVQHLASYLGIRPESLSRIRGSLIS